jgi:hypothetical protein
MDLLILSPSENYHIIKRTNRGSGYRKQDAAKSEEFEPSD